MTYRPEDLVEAVVGERITAITFIHDYFQIACEDIGMTFYACPDMRVVTGDQVNVLRFSSAGFAHAARGLVGAKIVAFRVSTDELVVETEDGRAVTSLFEGNLSQAGEGVVIQDAQGAIWVAP